MIEVSEGTVESIAEIKRIIAVLDDEPLTDSDVVDIAIVNYLSDLQHMMQHCAIGRQQEDPPALSSKIKIWKRVRRVRKP
jgi:hypothetical protein